MYDSNQAQMQAIGQAIVPPPRPAVTIMGLLPELGQEIEALDSAIDRLRGAAAMRQVEPKITAKMRLADHEKAPIRIAINTMDGLVGRLRLEALLYAMKELDAMNAAGMEIA